MKIKKNISKLGILMAEKMATKTISQASDYGYHQTKMPKGLMKTLQQIELLLR